MSLALGIGLSVSHTPVEHPNLVKNGSFNVDANWTKGTGITIENGSAVLPQNSNFIEQGIPTVSGQTYRVSATVANNNTFCGAWQVAGQNNQLSNTAATRSGTFHFDFVAGDTTSYIAFSAAGGTALLDNVTCYRI